MFSLAAVGMGQTDASGRLVAVNPKLCEMLGYTESELIGRLFTEVTHPEDVEESRRLMRDLWAGIIDDFAIYKRYVRKDGSFIWGHATVSLVPEIAGTERRTVAVIRDVTARVIAERSLRESEARYRRFASVVESSTDAIIAKDLDEIVLSWNSGAERMYGYTAEEAVGRPISSLIMPPDAQQEWTSLNKRALGGELVQDYDTVRVRKDGTRISVALTLWPLTDENGTVVGTSSIARDMSVRHQAMKEKEDALALVSALTNAAPVGLAFFDCDLRYRLVNEHLADMNGISAEAHLGHTVAELLPGMD
jgi:PAS domain S-box-containing protein